MEQYIPVSGVIACHICPRRYYFERSSEHPESPRYTVCKQVSTHLGELLDPERIWDEILCVLPDADVECRELLDECVAACRETAWQRPVQADLAVESDTLGIRGRVDKIFEDGTFADHPVEHRPESRRLRHRSPQDRLLRRLSARDPRRRVRRRLRRVRCKRHLPVR